jgi:predicted transcriptional regulator
LRLSVVFRAAVPPGTDASLDHVGESTIMTDQQIRTPVLAHIRVRDCMHHGLLSCACDAPLGEVAALMAKHRVHAVAINAPDELRPVGFVSDLDIAAAAASGERPTALQAAASHSVTVSADESLDRAAKLMGEHGVSHLIVLDAASGYPAGVLSTLDIAAAYATA